MHRSLVLAALFASASAAPALAQVSPWYIGLAMGQSKTDSELVSNRESTVVNAAVLGSDFDAEDGGFKFTGGYNFNRHLAIEVSYADLGSSRLTTHIVNQGLGGSVTLHRQVEGFGADLLARLPVGPRASLFGRLGVVRSRLEAEAVLQGNIVFTGADPDERSRSAVHTENVTRAGFGADFDFGRGMAMRVEWERWLDVGKPFAIGGKGTTGEADTDFYSVGFVYRF